MVNWSHGGWIWRGKLGLGIVAGVLAMTPLAGTAQETKPEIRRLEVVIPLSAGGGTDLLVRQLMEEVRPRIDAPIAILNIPGDGSLLGLSRVGRAAPDDAIIGFHNPPNTVLSQLARGAEAPTDIRQLTSIGGYGRTYTVLATSAQSGIESFEQLSKTFTGGEGHLIGGTDRAGSSELAALLLKSDVKLNWKEYIAYDGSGALNAALTRNEVPVGLASYDSVYEGMQTGALKPLLVLGATERLPGMPDTPTAAELGFPSLAEVAAPIRIVVGPPNMNPELRDYFVKTWREVIEDPKVIEKMREAKVTLEYIPPEEVDKAIQNAFAKLESLPALKEMMGK